MRFWCNFAFDDLPKESIMSLRIFIAASFISVMDLAANAQTYNQYDWQSGNHYTITPRYDGGIQLNGLNLNNGTTWSQTQRPDGSYSGFDGNGNYYYGNNRSGFYQNMGTGRTCIGTGAARSCY